MSHWSDLGRVDNKQNKNTRLSEDLKARHIEMEKLKEESQSKDSLQSHNQTLEVS
jgi:hypothetical protein